MQKSGWKGGKVETATFPLSCYQSDTVSCVPYVSASPVKDVEVQWEKPWNEKLFRSYMFF